MNTKNTKGLDTEQIDKIRDELAHYENDVPSRGLVQRIAIMSRPMWKERDAAESACAYIESDKHRRVDLSKFGLEQLRFIHHRAVEMQGYRNQWLEAQDFVQANSYENQLIGLVELMEHIMVFSVGNGIDHFGTVNNHTTDERLASIGKVFE